MDLPVGHKKSRKEFWLEHIKAADAYNGTLREYCQLHNLKMGSMSSYRTKLGHSTPRRKVRAKKKSEFIPVNVSSTPPRPSVPEKLPDPNWLAQFLKAWSSQ